MRRVILAVFGTVAGLVGLLSFKTHTTSVAAPPAAVSTTGPSTSTGGSTPAPAGSAGSSASAGSSSPASPATATKTVTGDAADTRYGPVQVRITVKNGTLTAVDAVEYPTNDPRDQEINSQAIPALNQEALSAGSASIDMISGATYTSQGYLSSLQSALDKAGI